MDSRSKGFVTIYCSRISRSAAKYSVLSMGVRKGNGHCYSIKENSISDDKKH